MLALAATAALGAGDTVGGATVGGAARPVLADTGASSGSGAVSAAIVATAEQYIGYRYAAVGDSPAAGFSCIGFAHFVFAQHGVYVPGDLASAYASAPGVDQSQLQPGDLVFFQNTVWAGISHVDIYIGNGKMIGADSYQTGVTWDTLSDAYWQQHYLGATRPLASLAASAANPAAPAAATDPAPTLQVTPSPTDTAINLAATPTTLAGATAPRYGAGPALAAGMTVTALRNAAVYSGPSAADAQVDLVTPAVPLTVMRTQGRWVAVTYDGGNQYGWVYGPDLKPTLSSTAGDSASPTVTAESGDNVSPTNIAMADSAATPRSGSDTAGAGPSGRVYAGIAATLQSAATIYDRPSTDGYALATLPDGTALAVLQRQGPWDLVVLPDGTAGWVDSSAVGPAGGFVPSGGSAEPFGHGDTDGQAAANPYVAQAATAIGRTVVVTADVLFVRDGASRRDRILRRVHAGDRLKVLAVQHGWDYVSLRDGSRGWVSAQWVYTPGAA